jgi:hypothetical protein
VAPVPVPVLVSVPPIPVPAPTPAVPPSPVVVVLVVVDVEESELPPARLPSFAQLKKQSARPPKKSMRLIIKIVLKVYENVSFLPLQLFCQRRNLPQRRNVRFFTLANSSRHNF